MSNGAILSDRRCSSVKAVLNTVYEDLKMLEAGVWVPDADSVQATLDNVKLIGQILGIKLEVSQFVKDDIRMAKAFKADGRDE
tara:strand:- start:577 stop:825 length:249 start_codon:yes stop_codon:yes gene_type:complete